MKVQKILNVKMFTPVCSTQKFSETGIKTIDGLPIIS